MKKGDLVSIERRTEKEFCLFCTAMGTGGKDVDGNHCFKCYPEAGTLGIVINTLEGERAVIKFPTCSRTLHESKIKIVSSR